MVVEEMSFIFADILVGIVRRNALLDQCQDFMMNRAVEMLATLFEERIIDVHIILRTT
jgi:hypothetical protein